ncbi:DedA family protein [Nonomuraea sp. B19D2]|uniref:DedA family protein n=1 Tax=Nonomuraea sp. B19D2 TaxID=3159561 RepID=UPI0032DBDEFC
MAIALAAAFTGDNVGYVIGQIGGRAFVHQRGRSVLLPPESLHSAEAFFARHGGKVVSVARFIEELHQANGVIAGTACMPWCHFLAFYALGAALWVGLWGSLPYQACIHITPIYDHPARYQPHALLALAFWPWRSQPAIYCAATTRAGRDPRDAGRRTGHVSQG